MYRTLRYATQMDCYMPDEETRAATINIRVKPSIKKAAERKAAEQNRSLTAYLEWLILQDTKKK
jgi:predicted HicB family RNase H-like nuclease